jgi:tetratricopeptide (TPR) repeat protein
MKLKLYSLLIIATTLLFSCKTAEKLYQRGQYDEAVEMAAKKLQKKPGDAGLIDIIQNAYRFAVNDHESRIRNYSNSSSDLRWENIYREYLDLQRLYETIRRSPSVYDLVQPTDYSSYISTYKEEAGNVRYERGLELMDQNTKKSNREAYYEFQKALALKPGDLSIKQKIEESYENAVTNVVVMPLTRFGYQYSAYNFNYNNFNYDLFRYLDNNKGAFLRYYSPSVAGSQTVRTDNTVEMRFSDVNIGRYRDQRSVREVSKQIVGKEIVIKKDSVVKEYITVKAKITTITRTIQADGLLQATVRDFNNRWLWSDTYRGDYSWSYSFATYTGDERALSEEDKKLLNQREQWPPSNDEIIRIIMEEIRRKTECGLSDYFNRMNG